LSCEAGPGLFLARSTGLFLTASRRKCSVPRLDHLLHFSLFHDLVSGSPWLISSSSVLVSSIESPEGRMGRLPPLVSYGKENIAPLASGEL
jgi:hypothetical protein